jgi:tRNA(Glu) U13 pseudouridine synthase TruD
VGPACRGCRMRGICVGNFEYCDKALQLGQLVGNHFQVLASRCRCTRHTEVEGR